MNFFKRKTQPTASGAISRKSGLASKGLIVFFSIFLLIGLVAFYLMAIRPLLYVAAAQDWAVTPCTIVSSEVGVHHGDDSITYSIDLTYKYEVRGKSYQSDRYHFVGGSSSGRAAKQAIVTRYPVGAKTTCYVDPDDPSEAVIERGLVGEMWFGLIPLVFVAIGGGGMLFALGVIRFGKKTGRAAWLPARAQQEKVAVAESPEHAGPLVLKRKWSPLGKFVGVVLVTLFFGGIISVLFWEVVEGFRRGEPEWFMTLFAIPFVLVSLALLGGIVYCFLVLFNPRPEITLSQPTITLGDSMTLRWKLHGRTHRIKRLRIHLRGEESATYRRGTDTHTSTNTFADFTLLDASEQLEMLSGQVPLHVPADSMHSFEASNNKILWSIAVEGEIRRWPDMNETFPLVVQPVPVSELAVSTLVEE